MRVSFFTQVFYYSEYDDERFFQKLLSVFFVFYGDVCVGNCPFCVFSFWGWFSFRCKLVGIVHLYFLLLMKVTVLSKSIVFYYEKLNWQVSLAGLVSLSKIK